jgi:hypothetical protein
MSYFTGRESSKVAAFFARNTCRIEVVDGMTALQRVYFAKPIICNYLTSGTRDRVNWDISRDTPQTKLTGLVESIDDIYVRRWRHLSHFPGSAVRATDRFTLCLSGVQEEMEHRISLKQIRGLSFVSNQLDKLRDLSIIMAFAINLLILLSYTVSDETSALGFAPP